MVINKYIIKLVIDKITFAFTKVRYTLYTCAIKAIASISAHNNLSAMQMLRTHSIERDLC